MPLSTIQRLSRLALLGIFKNIATIPQTGGEGEKGGGGEQGKGGGQASRRKLWQLKVGQVPHICLEPDGVPGNIQSCPGVKYHFILFILWVPYPGFCQAEKWLFFRYLPGALLGWC